MARIAFCAPLKSPTHPVPSGDRKMARLLMAALGGAHEVTLISELRSYDGRGDPQVQAGLIAEADREIARLRAGPAYDLWVTYHNYYKAPDLLGPALSAAWNAPYVLFEATRAAKRLNGPWDRFARAAEAGIDVADLIFHFTSHDAVSLTEHAAPGQRIVPLAPFLAARTIPHPAPVPPAHRKTILSVGMMRGPDKFASFARLAEVLALLKTPDWQLSIVGDGPRRAEVEALFAPFGARVTFTGQLDANALAQHFGKAAIFVWPGINEAYGMVYLEAQSMGLPALAEDRPGVRDVLPGGALTPADDPAAMAAALDRLLGDDAARAAAARAAHDHICAQHLFGAAQTQIFDHITPLLKDA